MQAKLTHKRLDALVKEDCITSFDDVVSTIQLVTISCGVETLIVELVICRRKLSDKLEWVCYALIIATDVHLVGNATGTTYSEAILNVFDRLGISFERPGIGSLLGCTGASSRTAIAVVFDAIASAVGIPNNVETKVVYANEWVPADKVVPIYDIVVPLPEKESDRFELLKR